jgi:hypothetical protein
MKLDNKGMATAELLFVTLIALVVIGAMLSLVSNEINQEQTGTLGEARITGENIAQALNTAYNGGNGYTVDIHLDPDPSFMAVIQNGTTDLTLFTGGKNVTIKIIPQDFNNGTYTFYSGSNYRIMNNNNTLTIIQTW